MVDPAAAQRIAPGDRMRLSRAMEVLGSDRPALSAWQADTAPRPAPPTPGGRGHRAPSATNSRRCDLRFAAMIEAGALEEVEALVAREASTRCCR